MNLGDVSDIVVRQRKESMTWYVHHSVGELRIKNIVVHRKKAETILWITLCSTSAKLNFMTVTKLKLLTEAIQTFWKEFFTANEAYALDCRITKVDVTMDFKGCF